MPFYRRRLQKSSRFKSPRVLRASPVVSHDHLILVGFVFWASNRPVDFLTVPAVDRLIPRPF